MSSSFHTKTLPAGKPARFSHICYSLGSSDHPPQGPCLRWSIRAIRTGISSSFPQVGAPFPPRLRRTLQTVARESKNSAPRETGLNQDGCRRFCDSRQDRDVLRFHSLYHGPNFIVPSGMIVWLKTAPAKSAPSMSALRRLARVRLDRLRFARVRSARDRSARVKFAPVKSASLRTTLTSLASLRFASTRVASFRNDKLKNALVRFAPLRFPPARMALLKSRP